MGVFQDPVSRQWYRSDNTDSLQQQPPPTQQDPFLLDQGIIKDPLSGDLYRVPVSSLDHWREPTAPPLAPQAPGPTLDDHATLADYGRSIMSGGAQIAQGAGWAARMLGAEDIGKSIEELGSNAVDYWNEGLSDVAKRELSKEFVTKNTDGEYEWGGAGLQTVALYGAQSLLGTAAGAGAGAGISKVLSLFANPIGRSALIKAAEAGSTQALKKLKLVDAAIGAAGFGAGEGLVAAPQSGVNVYKSVMEMTPEKIAENPRYKQVFESTDEHMPWLQRHQYAAETIAREASSVAGVQAGLTSALLGAPIGAYFGRIFGRTALASLAEGSRVGRIATGAAGEAAQEFAQSGVQQVVENKARQGAGDEVDTWDNVLNQALGGALAGAPIGATLGGFDGKRNPPSTATEPPGAAPPSVKLDPVRNAANEAVAAGVPQADVIEIVKGAAEGTEPVLAAVGRLKKLQMGLAAAGMSAVAAVTPASEVTNSPVEPTEISQPAQPAANATAVTQPTQPAPVAQSAAAVSGGVVQPQAEIPAAQSTTAPPVQVERAKPNALNGKDVKIEERFAKRIEANPDQMVSDYAKIEGTEGGKLLNTDLARELSPDYLKDRTTSQAVHEPASWLVKRMYTQKLAEQPAPGDLPEVLFTAGGTGSGKTSSLMAAAKINPDVTRAQIIYDTNMNGAKASIQKIEQALDAGKNVRILYTYREPIDALVNGAIPRAKRQAAKFGSGRTVPLEAHIDTHVGARDTMTEIAAKYADDPRVQLTVVDNSGGRDTAKVVPLEKIPQLQYDSVREQTAAALEREHAAGRIDQRQYLAFRGNLPAPGQQGPAPADAGVGGDERAAPDLQREGKGPTPVTSGKGAYATKAATEPVRRTVPPKLTAGPRAAAPQSGGAAQAPKVKAEATPIHAAPTIAPGDRWTPNRGAIPGEPIAYLDGNEDTATAAIMEVEKDGQDGVTYNATTSDGDDLGEFSTIQEAARAAEEFTADGGVIRDLPSFSRGTGKGAPETARVQKELGDFVKDIAPLVNVSIVESPADLPGDAIPGDVEGAWYGGNTVYLVAGNLPEGRAVAVVTHEVFGHLAMERYEEGRNAIELAKELHARNREVGKLWQEVGERQPNLTATDHAKEVIALMAERGDKHAVITRLVAGMKRFLRSLGFKTEFNDTDIRDLIARSARALRREADRARTLRPKLKALTPASTDADIQAALDEDLPPGVTAIDTYLQLRSDLDALNERGGEFEGATEQRTKIKAALQALEGQDETDDGVLRIPATREAQRQAALFSRAAKPDPAIQAIMDRTMSKPPEAYTMKDRARQIWDKVRSQNSLEIKQGLIDSFASIEDMERDFNGGQLLDASQSAYKAALATKNLQSVMAAVMLKGVPEYKNGAYTPVAGRKGVIEIFKPLTEHKDGNLLQQWELWAAAKRADRLIKEKNPDGTQRENLFTQPEIDEALKLSKKYPEFDQVQKDWAAFNKQMLDLSEASGMIDPAMRAQWERNDYVPFYRAIDVASGQAEGPRNRRGVANQRADIKRLRGSDKALGNVFENMMLNTAHLLDGAFKNRAMQRIVGLGTGTAMTPMPYEARAVKISDDQLARALSAAGLIVGNPSTDPYGHLIVQKMTPQQKQHWSTLFERVAPQGKNIVSVMENGKPQYYEVTDPLLLKSLAGMGYDNFADVMGLFRGSKKLLTHAITADPAFMMANFIRDTLSNWVQSDASTKPITGAISGLAATFKNDPVITDMMMAGAGGGGFYDSNPDEIRKLIANKVPASTRGGFLSSVVGPKNLWQVWRKVGAASENANRVAVFRAVLAKGGTVAEAAYQARDVMNFSMAGDYSAMRWLTQTVPFMNARVQGLYRLYRGARDNKMAFFLKGSMLLAATMALALRNNDRDEYEELPEWDKDTYWHLFVGGEHFRIPKPFEVGSMFATVPERMWRTLTGRDSGKLLFQRMAQMMSDTFAFNPTPQLVKPIIEQYANRSMFTGSPIVGMAEQNLQPEAQFTPWTSATMREFARLMPDWGPQWIRSPERLEAAMRAYTGSLGMYVLNVSDAMTRAAFGYPDSPGRKLTDLPVLSRFWKDSAPRHTKYADQLYDWMDESNQAYSTINRLVREQRLGEARELREQYKDKLVARVRLNKIGTGVRNINEQIRRIQLSRNMDGDLKRERIDTLVERKNLLLRQIAPFGDLF